MNAFIVCTSVLAMNTTLAVQILSFVWARRCKDLSSCFFNFRETRNVIVFLQMNRLGN